MFRIIRWLCFPIARRMRVWPIGVYFALLIPVTILRRVIYPPSAEAMAYLPDWVIPTMFGIFFVVFPLWTLLFAKRWYRTPPRSVNTDDEASDSSS